MVEVEIVEIRKAKLARIKFPRPYWEKVAKTVEGSILDNIAKQRQADGSALKTNAPSTRDAKRAAGRPLLSLVDKLHRFVKGQKRSWAVHFVTNNAGVIVRPATAELKKISRWVQEKGYTGWFGVSREGVKEIRKTTRDLIKAEIRKAARK